MRRFGVVVGLVLLAVVLGFSPSSAFYNCSATATGTAFIGNTISGYNQVDVWHITTLGSTTIKVGTCGHDPAGDNQARVTLYQQFGSSTATNKTGLSKNSAADCDLGGSDRFDGKVSKSVTGANKEHHAMTSFDFGSTGDIHVCIEGNVSVFLH